MNPLVDLIIPAAPKDYNKVRYVISQAREHVNLDTVHVVVPEPDKIQIGFDDVFVHADDDVLPYDRDEMSFRPNWVFQQFLKVFQDVTPNDWYLVLDADVFPAKRMPLWSDDGKPILNLGRDQYYEPYFSFNEEMLGFGKVYNWSFLSECTLYSKTLVREMLTHCGLTLDGFWTKAVEMTARGCRMADSELYGSYVYRQHPGVYDIRNLTVHLGGRYGSRQYTDGEIEKEIKRMKRDKPEVDIFSLHSWEGG